MNSRLTLTAYCGLYCQDCIPSQKRLFKLLQQLEQLLGHLNFGAYARLKAKTLPEFKDYRVFAKILKAMRKLECTKPCRQGGGKPTCAIRACARSEDFEGCWECRSFKTCAQLAYLKKIHPGLEYNLRTLARSGVNYWVKKRGPHYQWSSTKGK